MTHNLLYPSTHYIHILFIFSLWCMCVFATHHIHQSHLPIRIKKRQPTTREPSIAVLSWHVYSNVFSSEAHFQWEPRYKQNMIFSSNTTHTHNLCDSWGWILQLTAMIRRANLSSRRFLPSHRPVGSEKGSPSTWLLIFNNCVSLDNQCRNAF